MPRLLAPAVLAALLLCACAGDPPPPAPRPVSPLPPVTGVIRLGGTGAMTPLVEGLAAAFDGGPRIVLEESIGSGGGVRAAHAGAIDVGLVSRPLTPEERSLGLLLIPAGRDAVVLAANPAVGVTSLTSAQVLALYQGRPPLADGRPALQLLLRDRGESANDALERLVPGLHQARLDAYRQRRFRVLYHDSAMAEALAATPLAVGVFPLGALVTYRLRLRPLAIDGVVPSQEALADGRWRATRDLALVVRPDRLPLVQGLLDFIASPAGRRIAVSCGYLPP